jgi:predicted metal-dependent hydrolase
MNLFRPRFNDGDVLEIDGLRVRLKVNRRARRISLRIDAAKREAVAVAPSQRRLSEAASFARERSQWAHQRLAAGPPSRPFAPDGKAPLRGRLVRLVAAGNASAARLIEEPEGPVIVSGGEGDAFARRVENLLRREALKDLTERTEHHARTLGLRAPKVGIGDPKSRWGSCTPGRASIRYSWRLILAPSSVLDYVAAHEVAHLVHADHSPRFWAVVKTLAGPHLEGRAWLKSHGGELHAVGR